VVVPPVVVEPPVVVVPPVVVEPPVVVVPPVVVEPPVVVAPSVVVEPPVVVAPSVVVGWWTEGLSDCLHPADKRQQIRNKRNQKRFGVI